MLIRIKKGLDIKLAGAPGLELAETPPSKAITIYPQEFQGIKHRLIVREGDKVARGGALFEDKHRQGLRICSPVSGTIQSIVLGARRVLERIVIETSLTDRPDLAAGLTPAQVLALSREDVLGRLLHSGFFTLIRQRPFSRIPDPAAKPKSVFVNAMNTAPFQADPRVAIRGHEEAFQAGLNALTRLTRGRVHLCLAHHPSDPASILLSARNVEIHTFAGPHPSGNTSVHIHHIDPIRPGDTVWTIKAADLIQIGLLLMEGTMPSRRIVALGGPGVKPEARRHYRVGVGAPLREFLGGKLMPGEQRIIGGDVLMGDTLSPDGSIRFFDTSLTVIPERRDRHFLGWLAPGLNLFSQSRTFLSAWIGPKREWALDTGLRGDRRALVLTGLYDRYVPMDILTDFLVRAALAHDTEEAVKLGILETDPEDFALCSVVCPSKMDIPAIIRACLAEIEQEGL